MGGLENFDRLQRLRKGRMSSTLLTLLLQALQSSSCLKQFPLAMLTSEMLKMWFVASEKAHHLSPTLLSTLVSLASSSSPER